MKYKMVVSDFDGTLYTEDYRITDATKEAIAEYVKRGGKMVIATGRLYQAISSHAKDLNLKGELIAYQGSGVFDIETGELLYSRDIAPNLAIDVLKYMYDRVDYDIIPMMFYDDKCYIMEENEFTRSFADIVRIEPQYAGERLDKYILNNGIVPRKLLALVAKSKARDLVNLLRGEFGEMFNVNQSGSVLVEMVNIEASKGNAVAWLAEKYGIQREEIICIGDAENDNSMIEYAGLGVAMGNALEVTKAVADYITDTNDNDGVARVINKFCFNN